MLLLKSVSKYARNLQRQIPNGKKILAYESFCDSASECDSSKSDYHPEVNCLINSQITAEYNASFAYLSMSCYFGRSDIALPGCQGFFLNMHEEEHQHVMSFIKYHLMRGGTVNLCPLHCPKDQDWKCIVHALSCALEMEKLIKKKLEVICKVGADHCDDGVVDWVTGNFIQEQDRSICEFTRLLTRANELTKDAVGEYLFDKLIHKSFVAKAPSNTATEIIDVKTYK